MATPLSALNIGILSNIFVFLLVFILAYVIMVKTEYFKEKEGLAGLIAVILGFIIIMSKGVVSAITNVTPWLILLIFFIFLIMLIFGLFGAKEKDFMSALKHNDNQLLNTILGIGIGVVVLTFLINLIGGSSEGAKEFMASLFTDMRILGIIILFVIAFVALLLITNMEAPIKK